MLTFGCAVRPPPSPPTTYFLPGPWGKIVTGPHLKQLLGVAPAGKVGGESLESSMHV